MRAEGLLPLRGTVWSADFKAYNNPILLWAAREAQRGKIANLITLVTLKGVSYIRVGDWTRGRTMNGISKRGRGRPRGSGKAGDLTTLQEIAKLVRADGTVKPTTAIRRLIGDNNPSAVRRLQMKWQRGKSWFLDEAALMEIEQYDPERHADAPKGARVRVNANNRDHWNRISLAGWNQERGLSGGEWIMRRDFPRGFLSSEDMPKYFEQCLRLMGNVETNNRS
jgi:hypothetical protein